MKGPCPEPGPGSGLPGIPVQCSRVLPPAGTGDPCVSLWLCLGAATSVPSAHGIFVPGTVPGWGHGDMGCLTRSPSAPFLELPHSHVFTQEVSLLRPRKKRPNRQ